MANFLAVNVKNKKRTFINENALSISSYNKKGIFDILPFHANFISMIKQTLTVKTPEHIFTMQFEEGVLMVQNDSVMIFISDLDPYFEVK